MEVISAEFIVAMLTLEYHLFSTLETVFQILKIDRSRCQACFHNVASSSLFIVQLVNRDVRYEGSDIKGLSQLRKICSHAVRFPKKGKTGEYMIQFQETSSSRAEERRRLSLFNKAVVVSNVAPISLLSNPSLSFSRNIHDNSATNHDDFPHFSLPSVDSIAHNECPEPTPHAKCSPIKALEPLPVRQLSRQIIRLYELHGTSLWCLQGRC